MPVKQSISLISLGVRDYDEALQFFVGKLGFVLVEDSFVSAQNKRWVVVAPRGSGDCRLLLARASSEEQKGHIGSQTGGRVFLFLSTDGKKGSGRLLLEGEKLKLTINDPVPLISPPGAESRENSPMMRRPNQALAPTAVVVAHL